LSLTRILDFTLESFRSKIKSKVLKKNPVKNSKGAFLQNQKLYDLQNEKNRIISDDMIDKVILKLEALKKAPQRDIISLFRIAEAYLEVKDYKNALRYFNKVLEVEPQNSDGIWGRAMVAYYLEDFKLSLDDLTHYLTICPEDSVAYSNRGLIYDNLGETDFALHDYNHAIKIDPEDANVYVNRGNLYSDLEKLDFALYDYNHAIEINPQLAQAYINRGNLYDNLGEIDFALHDYNCAIEIDP
jgi:tetratricopeptide (TPR) repeat protein